MSKSRRYPRLNFKRAGEMIYRARATSETPARDHRVAVVIRNISCEGARLDFAFRERPKLRRGATVTLEFSTTRGTMTLPAQIAWQSPVNGERPCAGVGLRLELAPARERRRYAHWIVTLTEEALALSGTAQSRSRSQG
jgi:hypothetical protein